MYYVYTVLNKKDNIIYIGMSVDPLIRWTQHAQADTDLGRALSSVGLLNFDFKIIASFNSKTDCLDYEKFLIEQYKQNQEFGIYNKKEGVERMPEEAFSITTAQRGRPRRPIVATNTSTAEEIMLITKDDVLDNGFLESAISNCVNGRTRSHRGFSFRLATQEEYLKSIEEDVD